MKKQKGPPHLRRPFFYGRGTRSSPKGFQRQLDESGILAELVEKCVQENDTILIGEYQFDYIF